MDKDNKKTTQNHSEKDEGKILLGKSHNESKPNTEKKDMREMKKEPVRTEDPEKKIEIDDNPGETERKIPRMKHP